MFQNTNGVILLISQIFKILIKNDIFMRFCYFHF